MDGLWSALLNAVADLVSGNEAELDARRYKRDCLTLMLIHVARNSRCLSIVQTTASSHSAGLFVKQP